MSEILLLKHGNPRAYRLCDTCQNYAVNLSFRGWCPACEWECKEVGRKARAKLASLNPTPIPNELACSTGPENAQSISGEPG